MPIDLNKVGQDKPAHDATELFDSQMGRYADPVDGLSEDRKYPLKQFPMGPDPTPFDLGPMAPGERK
jgi:hypothetical protein